MKINNSKVLITGGASGIGFGLVESFHKLNAKVAILDLNIDPISSFVKDSPRVISYKCDVTDISSVNYSIEKIFEEFGYINILINNAGLMSSEPLINLLSTSDKKHSIDSWNKTLDVNLNSVFYVTRIIVEKLIEKRQKGVIINMSSISAKGNAGQSAYSAAKAGVEALTKVWAKELGPMGIRSASIAPGFCNTYGLKKSLHEKVIKNWISNVPIRRLSSIDEIVDAVIFIVKNDFFNGKVLNIDGGIVI